MKQGIATGLHLFDPAGKGWNVAEVSDRFKAAPVVLVRWSIRQRGLIFSRELSHTVKQMTDVRGLRLVPRQQGAGAQRLLDLLLRDACVEPEEVVLTEPASSEADAALAIREGRADATLGLATVAFQYDLAFQPIVDEAFDLLVDRKSWFEPQFQALIEFAGTARFRERAAAFPGYEIGTCGKVLFNGL
ncbi:MAG: substrate-binding domain-containing protein [Pseudomonadota bacterium]